MENNDTTERVNKLRASFLKILINKNLQQDWSRKKGKTIIKKSVIIKGASESFFLKKEKERRNIRK